MDPNQKLAETQAIVMRAIADQHRHSEMVGQLVGRAEVEAVAMDALTAANERIAELERQQQRFTTMVIDRFRLQLKPRIEEYRSTAGTFARLGISYSQGFSNGYAQALEDFLDGALTR